MPTRRTTVMTALVAGIVSVHAAGGFAREMRGRALSVNSAQASSGAPQQAGTATGTLTVGSSTIQLSHAYVFPEKDKADPSRENYRVFVTDRPLNGELVTLARTAGSNDADRQQLAVELAIQEVRGLEMLVGADKRIVRVSVYSPDSAMGMILFSPTQFEATALDAQKIAGKMFTETPIEDARIGKTVQYEATFSAAVDRSGAK